MNASRLATLISIAVGSTALFGTVARADPDPAYTFAKPPDAKDVKAAQALKAPEWTATAEAGAVITTGNSENTNLTGGIKVSRRTGDNKLEIAGAAAYAEASTSFATDLNGNGTIGPNEISTKKSVTAEALEGKLRYDRFLTDANSLYIAAIARRDLPAGKRFVASLQAGYSRQLYKTAKHEVVGELGYDFSYEQLVGTIDPTTMQETDNTLSIHSARAFLGYKGAVSDTTTVDASFEYLGNINTLDTVYGTKSGFFDDSRINASAGVTAKVGKDLSLNITYAIKFDNVPAPLAIAGVTFDPGYIPSNIKLDTIMKASLIYSFF